jgi:hypothetical protein
MNFLIYLTGGDPMSSSGKAGNGRGNNRKRPFRRRDNAWQEGDLSSRFGGESRKPQAPAKGSGAQIKRGNENTRIEKFSYFERPKWIPPSLSTDPLPVSNCPWCGKPIRDMSSAIADKDSGYPVHFDCVTARIAFGERLEKGDSIAYIGGGRFGIVSFGSTGPTARSSPMPNTQTADSQDRSGNFQVPGRSPSPPGRGFTIKKIIEWESKDKRAEWRSVISDHYSVT